MTLNLYIRLNATCSRSKVWSRLDKVLITIKPFLNLFGIGPRLTLSRVLMRFLSQGWKWTRFQFNRAKKCRCKNALSADSIINWSIHSQQANASFHSYWCKVRWMLCRTMHLIQTTDNCSTQDLVKTPVCSVYFNCCMVATSLLSNEVVYMGYCLYLLKLINNYMDRSIGSIIIKGVKWLLQTSHSPMF